MRTKQFDHDAILADYLEGMPVSGIAAKHGCSGNIGTILAKRRGVSRSAEVVKQVRLANGRNSIAGRAKTLVHSQRLKRNKRIAESAKRDGIAATATKFGLSDTMIRTIAKQHGWTSKPLDQQAILRDYLNGMKLRAIAEKHGCNQAYPTQLAKRAGKLRQNRIKQR